MIKEVSYEDIEPMWQHPEVGMTSPVSTMRYYEDNSKSHNGGCYMRILDPDYSDPKFWVYTEPSNDQRWLGCISCHWTDHLELRARGMFVDPQYRKQGIATKLLGRVVSHACEYGAYRIWCLAGPNSIPVHLKRGFTLVSRQYQGDLPDGNWVNHNNAYMSLYP